MVEYPAKADEFCQGICVDGNGGAKLGGELMLRGLVLLQSVQRQRGMINLGKATCGKTCRAENARMIAIQRGPR